MRKKVLLRFLKQCLSIYVASLFACGFAAAAEPSPKVPLPTSVNSLGMQLVELPAADFVMGEESYNKVSLNHPTSIQVGQGFEDDRPALPTRLTKPFAIAAHEVTVGRFRAFVTATGYKTDAERTGRGAFTLHPQAKLEPDRFALDPQASWKNPGFEQTDEHPVVCVSWNDANAFCAWLSKSEGASYRLPTEAEWEYACRGGTTTVYSCGDDPNLLYAHGNLGDGALEKEVPGIVARQRADRLKPEEGDGVTFTAPVGKFKPNPFGLYDTHGNVWEWCRDRYQDRLYAARQKDLQELRRMKQPVFVVDPQGPDTTPQHQYGDWRSVRGGSWYVSPISCRSATRSFAEAGDAFSYTGFRVVREVAGTPK
ncbi:MAG: formylglycine-generating enzyme family protein [Planctomycetia bacterium]|nr:formylglycine-generating enzyme family protein [Planctomycetia bacterium]